MRNFGKRIALLCITTLILANLAFTDGHDGEQGGGVVRVWRFVSANDEITKGFFESFTHPPYPRLVYHVERNQVGVSGICNGCGTGLDEISFVCTAMSCGEEKDKAEQFVIKTLTQNGLGFVKGDTNYGTYHIEGTEGNKLVLTGFWETTEDELRNENGRGDGNGDGHGRGRGDKKKSGSILAVFFVGIMGFVFTFMM